MSNKSLVEVFKLLLVAFISICFYKYVYVKYGHRFYSYVNETVLNRNKIGKDWSIDTVKIFMDDRAEEIMEQRVLIARKYRRGHRVIEPNEEKFKVQFQTEKNTILEAKAWIKGGTGPHYRGSQMPSINIKQGDRKFALARFSSRNGLVDFICSFMVKKIGLIDNQSELKHITLNGKYQGVYWQEYKTEDVLNEKGYNGFIIDFNLDYMWSRNYFIYNDWTGYLEDPFYHAPIKIKKVHKKI